MNGADEFVFLQSFRTRCPKPFSYYINFNGQESKIDHLKFIKKNSHNSYAYKNCFLLFPQYNLLQF